MKKKKSIKTSRAEVLSLVQGDKELLPLPSTKGPLVFMWQPTHYRKVTTNEELKLWEQMMWDRLPMLNRERTSMRRGGESWSFCPHFDD